MESLEEPTAAGAEPRANGYATVNAASLFQLYNFQTMIQAPLRFDIDDFGIRKADWDSAGDYLRIFRCARIDFMDVADRDTDNWAPLRYREDGECSSWTPTESVGDIFREGYDFTYYSLRMAPLRGFSLGYGSIVHGYDAMLEEDFYRAGLTGELNLNRVFVLTAGLSDIVDPTVMAARAVVRPVNSREDGSTSLDPRKELFVELGVTTAADFSAPTRATDGSLDEEGVYAGGVEAHIRWSSADDYSRESYKITRFELGSEYNRIFGRDGGLHTHLRFYHDVGVVDFYVDGEYRLVEGRYMPAYFDAHYRVQREQFVLSDDQRERFGVEALSLTKADFLDTLPDDIEHAYAATFRLRFWPWSESQSAWTQDGADLWLFFEDIPTRALSGRAGVGLTLYDVADKLRVWGEFVQQGWDDLDGLLQFNNSVLNVRGIYWLTEQVYLNVFFDQTWFLLDSGAFDTTNDFGLSVGFADDV